MSSVIATTLVAQAMVPGIPEVIGDRGKKRRLNNGDRNEAQCAEKNNRQIEEDLRRESAKILRHSDFRRICQEENLHNY